jgi:hypothetical protein
LLERGQLTLKVPAFATVDVHRTIGASGHTGPGSTANILIDENDTVRPAGDGLGRASLHAGSIFTMHTQRWKKYSLHMRECSYLLLIYRGVPDARRRAVFNMARNRTRITTNASVEINNHPPVRHRSSPPLRGCAIIEFALRCHVAHEFSGGVLIISTANLKVEGSRRSIDAMY